MSGLNLTIQATVSLPAEVSWALRYTVSKKKYRSVTSKKYFAGCSVPKDNLQEVLRINSSCCTMKTQHPKFPVRESCEKDGLVYAFRLTSATERYLAAVVDSI